MGSVVRVIDLDCPNVRAVSQISLALSKIGISGEIQKASQRKGLSREALAREMNWDTPKLGEILGGGDYGIESLLSVLDLLDLELSVVPKR
jgi:hypothetical protein